MSFSRGLKAKAEMVWEEGYRHPFVQEIGQGILDREKFRFYLLQDYQYLLAYAKVFALGTLKAEDEEVMKRFTDMQAGVLGELELHKSYMLSFDVPRHEIDAVKPSLFNRAYTSNMLAVGQVGDVAEILATVLPCAWTYSDYGKRLAADYADRLEGNYFKSWIDTYASDDFQESFQWFFDVMDRECAEKSESARQKVADIFVASVECEYLFWDMSYGMRMSY